MKTATRAASASIARRLGIEYLVLKRAPAPGLPGARSTDLRGF